MVLEYAFNCGWNRSMKKAPGRHTRHPGTILKPVNIWTYSTTSFCKRMEFPVFKEIW